MNLPDKQVYRVFFDHRIYLPNWYLYRYTKVFASLRLGRWMF